MFCGSILVMSLYMAETVLGRENKQQFECNKVLRVAGKASI